MVSCPLDCVDCYLKMVLLIMDELIKMMLDKRFAMNLKHFSIVNKSICPSQF